jgi:diguanylate cyclase (GGDEF)-like protein
LLKKLSYQANVDGLTGVLNRRELMQQGEKEIEAAFKSDIPLGVILIDLDHFKMINDTHGHIVGDEVLKSVVTCLRGGLRSIDVIGRYGGEEFLLLLPGVDAKNLAVVAERLRKGIQDHDFKIKKAKVKLTASFGIYIYEPKMTESIISIEKMLAAADRALYKAKANGRNQIACSS